MQGGWSSDRNIFLPAVKHSEALSRVYQAVVKLTSFTKALSDSVVLEMAINFRNQGAGVRI